MMSATDHRRPRRQGPEHADQAPRYHPRPEPRRGRTRRQAVTLELRTYGRA